MLSKKDQGKKKHKKFLFLKHNLFYLPVIQAANFSWLKLLVRAQTQEMKLWLRGSEAVPSKPTLQQVSRPISITYGKCSFPGQRCNLVTQGITSLRSTSFSLLTTLLLHKSTGLEEYFLVPQAGVDRRLIPSNGSQEVFWRKYFYFSKSGGKM